MKKSRILLSLMTEENDYQLEQAASARRAAEGLPVELQILFAGNDTITQSTQILRAIQGNPTTRPDAVILEPVRGTALSQVARAACAAGIGWGGLNNVPECLSELQKGARAPIFSMSTDQEEIGRIQGRQFAALLPRGGTVLYIQGPSENSAAKERTTGMQETKPAGVQVVLLKAQWTEESSLRAVRSWLKLTTSQKSTIDLVGAQDDSMAMGARKAFQEL